MRCPNPVVLGDAVTVTEHVHLIQIGAHEYPAPHCGGVHRVVIAVQTDVVITRQPQR